MSKKCRVTADDNYYKTSCLGVDMLEVKRTRKERRELSVSHIVILTSSIFITGILLVASNALAQNASVNINALNNIGNALYDQKNFTGAIKYYDKVLGIDPKNVKTLVNEGLVLDKVGKPMEAKKIRDKAVQIDPNAPIAVAAPVLANPTVFGQ